MCFFILFYYYYYYFFFFPSIALRLPLAPFPFSFTSLPSFPFTLLLFTQWLAFFLSFLQPVQSSEKWACIKVMKRSWNKRNFCRAIILPTYDCSSPLVPSLPCYCSPQTLPPPTPPGKLGDLISLTVCVCVCQFSLLILSWYSSNECKTNAPLEGFQPTKKNRNGVLQREELPTMVKKSLFFSHD